MASHSSTHHPNNPHPKPKLPPSTHGGRHAHAHAHSPHPRTTSSSSRSHGSHTSHSGSHTSSRKGRRTTRQVAPVIATHNPDNITAARDRIGDTLWAFPWESNSTDAAAILGKHEFDPRPQILKKATHHFRRLIHLKGTGIPRPHTNKHHNLAARTAKAGTHTAHPHLAASSSDTFFLGRTSAPSDHHDAIPHLTAAPPHRHFPGG